MKKLFYLTLSVFLFTSCQQYDNSIHGRGVAQSCNWLLPTSDSVRQLINAGYVSVQLQKNDSALPAQVCDSTVIVSPTWKQALQWAGKRKNLVWFWLGWLLVPAGFVISYLLANRNKAGANDYKPLLGAAVAILGIIMAGAAIETEHSNTDQAITKQRYQENMARDGDLHEVWDKVRVL